MHGGVVRVARVVGVVRFATVVSVVRIGSAFSVYLRLYRDSDSRLKDIAHRVEIHLAALGEHAGFLKLPAFCSEYEPKRVLARDFRASQNETSDHAKSQLAALHINSAEKVHKP